MTFALVGHQQYRLGRRRCDSAGEAGMRHSERKEPGHLVARGNHRQPIGR
jgi:hypothetical protein